MFVTVVMIVVMVAVPLGVAPDAAGEFISVLYASLTRNFGIAYQVLAGGAILFLIWLAFGRFGRVRLGGAEGDPPDFSTFSWAGMLFCAGTGASLLAWASVEWAYYYAAPPFAAEPASADAIQWAKAYGPFHWGIVAWAFYAVPTIAIAYPYYVKGVPRLRASTSCHGLLAHEEGVGVWSRAIDTFAMIALIGGAGSSLGMVAPMIASVLAELMGVEVSFGLQVGVILLCVALFAFSVYMGIEKGIKRLSDLNVVVALLLLAYILAVGPTLFILTNTVETIGFMATNFITMLTWTDPGDTGFVENWTIFYWAWWVAFAPVVGIFVARISRGRTIRQVILSMIFFGTLGCWLFYFIMGNYALFLELESILPVVDILQTNGMDAATAKVIASLPWGIGVLVVFALVSIISVATTYDSASYTLASTATREVKANSNPGRMHRMFWAFVLGVLPVMMMIVGGLDIIRSGVLIASLPVIVIGIAMAVSLVKSLRADEQTLLAD